MYNRISKVRNTNQSESGKTCKMSAFLYSMEICLPYHKWCNESIHSGLLGVSPDSDFCIVTGSTALYPYFWFSFWFCFPVFRILAACWSLGPIAHPAPDPAACACCLESGSLNPCSDYSFCWYFTNGPLIPQHTLTQSRLLIIDLPEMYIVYCLRDWNCILFERLYSQMYETGNLHLWIYN